MIDLTSSLFLPSLLAQAAPPNTEFDPARMGMFFVVFGFILGVVGVIIIVFYRLLYPRPATAQKEEKVPEGFDPATLGLSLLSPASASPLAGQIPLTGAPPADPPEKRGPQHDVLLAINGQQAGPYTRDQVIEMVATGRIAAYTLCWTPGQENWDPVSRL